MTDKSKPVRDFASSREAKMEASAPALTPKLRFPEFREAGEWETEQLGALFSERQQSGFSDLPLLSLMDKEGIVPQEQSNRKNNSNSDKSKYLRVVPGDIAYNTMRMWEGRSAYVGIEGLVSPAYTVCQPNIGVQSLFFSYYFKLPELIERFRRYSQGLVKDTLNLKYEAFSQIAVITPKYSEQQKIADCLSSVDELIAAQARKVEALKAHKKGLMQQLFPRAGETQPRLRFPEFRGAGDWEIDSFDKLIEVIDGDRGLYYPKAQEFAQSGFCLFLSAKNVTKSGFKFEETQFISKEKDEVLRNGKLMRADVVLTTRGTVGQVAYYSDGIPYENIRINSGMVILRSKSKKIIPNYLYCFTTSESLKLYIKNTAFGNAQLQLTVGEIKKFKLNYPEPDEQQHIADCLHSLDDLIAAESQKLAALKTHKKGLMQQLFPSPEEVEP